MFGGGENIDKKFVNKIIQKVKSGQDVIEVASDCTGSPTYSMDLADGIKHVLENEEIRYGVHNCVNESDRGVLTAPSSCVNSTTGRPSI